MKWSNMLFLIWANIALVLFAQIVQLDVSLLPAFLISNSVIVLAICRQMKWLKILSALIGIGVVMTAPYFFADAAHTLQAMLARLTTLGIYQTPLVISTVPAYYNGLFYACCFSVMSLFLYASFSQKKKRYVLVVTVIAMLLQLMFQTTPHPFINSAYFIVTLGIFMTVHTHRAPLRYIYTYMAVLVLVAGVSQLVFPIKQIEPKALALIEQWRYGETDMLMMPQGNLTETTPLQQVEATALRVVMEQPQPMYIRGFVGERYAQTSWQALQPERYLEHVAMFQALSEKDFTAATQYASATQVEQTKSVLIENVAASSRYMYAPYETASLPAQLKTIDYGQLKTTGFFGQRMYQYDMATTSYVTYPTIAEQRQQKALPTYDMYEQHYRTYVYEQFRELPDETRQLLQHHIAQVPSVTTYDEAIQFVRGVLKDELTYNEQTAFTVEQDVIATLLEEQKEGYAPHFATAGTVLFRALNIPARYVEGYIVTANDIQSTQAFQEIIVPESNAHAWVEIYIDAVGWMPVEVTPPYVEKMPAVEQLKTASVTAPTQQEIPDTEMPATTSEVQQVAQQPPINEPPTTVEHQTSIVWNFIGFMVMVLLFLIMHYMYRRQKRQRAFKTANYQEAIIQMMAYSLRVVDVSPEQFATYFAEHALQQEAARSMNIYQKARYSQHALTDEERQHMAKFYKDIYAMTKRATPLLQKWRFIWRNA